MGQPRCRSVLLVWHILETYLEGACGQSEKERFRIYIVSGKCTAIPTRFLAHSCIAVALDIVAELMLNMHSWQLNDVLESALMKASLYIHCSSSKVKFDQ